LVIPNLGIPGFQDIVAGLAFGALPEFIPPLLVQDLVPDVFAAPHYKRYATPMFFKSHALPTPDYKRVVYLLRDGRDAMVFLLSSPGGRRKRKDRFFGGGANWEIFLSLQMA
jgi:hypothetical protein